MKLNITMKDGSVLNDVKVYYKKTLDDSVMTTQEQFTTAMKNNRTMFFGGKYVQGGFIPCQIESYEFLEHEKSIDELAPFDEESENIASNIINEINTYINTDILKSYVDKLHNVVKTINKYR